MSSLLERSVLSDAQIERFARQIVLPEVGGRGQERLLGARVRLVASAEAEPARDTLLLCALHLGVAGVGTLAVDEEWTKPLAEALAARNPEVEITGDSSRANATIAIGDSSLLARCSPTLFGGAGPAELVVAIPRARCSACVGAAAPALASPRTWPNTLAPLLASLLATVTLRALLQLAASDEPTLLVVGLLDAGATTRVIARRPDCLAC